MSSWLEREIGDLIKWFWWFLYLFVFVAAWQSWFTPQDSTDPPGRNWIGSYHRSGINPYRDAETGCEYLGRGGALTPRLDATGKHICRAAGGSR